ncbi:MAG: bifunctional demethylmenaquinone methyltransferase/2-methoxy-6-polyprenyl-1,4-benzoquinol methylase UbiE [Ignavibacteriales bacterium]|nr:bifunctional demethylmenaquinone methyltransferase/2-methoxy-6-polyprenyl-1,4-benzoquinol methylase UbiE [Ignavibacteriales bacterium]
MESFEFSQPAERGPATRNTYEPAYVRSLFNRIAPRYDLLNHLLSSGIDIWWRKRAIRRLRFLQPSDILDVATGTGDFAFEAARSLSPKRVVGMDVAENMLALGREKAERKKLGHIVSFREGTAEKLPFPEDSFDAVLSAFGVRNFSDLDTGLLEMRRVLRPGGAVLILEFSHPHAFPVKQLYNAYSQTLLPALGGLISRDPEAYRYLPSTIGEFPDGEDFLECLRKAGFRSTRRLSMTFGIATAYDALK